MMRGRTIHLGRVTGGLFVVGSAGLIYEQIIRKATGTTHGQEFLASGIATLLVSLLATVAILDALKSVGWLPMWISVFPGVSTRLRPDVTVFIGLIVGFVIGWRGWP